MTERDLIVNAKVASQMRGWIDAVNAAKKNPSKSADRAWLLSLIARHTAAIKQLQERLDELDVKEKP